jgi:flagellar motor component MotA
MDTGLVRVVLSYRKYFNKDLVRTVSKMVQTLRKDGVEKLGLTHTVIHIDLIKNILQIPLLIQGTELSEGL